jgi:hypothetical protein
MHGNADGHPHEPLNGENNGVTVRKTEDRGRNLRSVSRNRVLSALGRDTAVRLD